MTYREIFFRYGLLQVNLGEVVYPGYVVSKSTPVFSSREDLIESVSMFWYS